MPIIDQRWIKTGRRKDSGCRNNCGKGTLSMDLYPMEMKVVNMRNSDDAMSPIITMNLFSTAKRVNVCDYLQIQKHTRLYFCPKQFRVPFNLDNAWDSDSFRRLKWFIEHSSAQGNSAVKCDDRGKEKSKNVSFRCIHDDRRCPFCFVVKVDQYGFFIHLYNHDLERFVGCSHHKHFGCHGHYTSVEE